MIRVSLNYFPVRVFQLICQHGGPAASSFPGGREVLTCYTTTRLPVNVAMFNATALVCLG